MTDELVDKQWRLLNQITDQSFNIISCQQQKDRTTERQRDRETGDRETGDREKERQNSLYGKGSSDNASNKLMLSAYLCHKESPMNGLLSTAVVHNRILLKTAKKQCTMTFLGTLKSGRC